MSVHASARHPWDGHVFLLLCPDAVARRLCTPIVRRFERSGFELVDCALARVTPAGLDAAFGEVVVAAGEVYRYRLLDRVFGFGPSVAAVLRDTAGREDPYAGLRAVKGAIDPVRAEPGSVRWDFGAVNLLLGLVHAADSAEASAHEAGLLAPEAGFHPDRPPLANPAAHDVLALVDGGPREHRGYRATLSLHRARVLAACHRDLSPRSLASARHARDEGALSEPGVGARIAQGLDGGPAHPAFALLSADWRPRAAALDLGDLGRRLGALGLASDPWEDVVLSTSARFAPRLDHPADLAYEAATVGGAA